MYTIHHHLLPIVTYFLSLISLRNVSTYVHILSFTYLISYLFLQINILMLNFLFGHSNTKNLKFLVIMLYCFLENCKWALCGKYFSVLFEQMKQHNFYCIGMQTNNRNCISIDPFFKRQQYLLIFISQFTAYLLTGYYLYLDMTYMLYFDQQRHPF